MAITFITTSTIDLSPILETETYTLPSGTKVCIKAYPSSTLITTQGKERISLTIQRTFNEVYDFLLCHQNKKPW